MHKPETHDGTGKPEDRAQEGERLARLPSVAYTTPGDPCPVEDAAVAVGAVREVDKEAEDREPGGAQDEVGGPVNEATGEWQQPDDREEDGEACDHFGVDEAGTGPGVGGVITVEV